MRYITGTKVVEIAENTFTVTLNENSKTLTHAANIHGCPMDELIKHILDSAQIEIYEYLRKTPLP